jgi:hypothetical protein
VAKHKFSRIVLRPPDRLKDRNPNQLGGSMSNYLPPGAQYEYQPKSVFAEHRAATVLFALLVLLALIYWAMAPRHDKRFVAPPKQPASPASAVPAAAPVYVQPLPSRP